jgi:hypothetical protein
LAEKKYLALSKEFRSEGVCKASKKYQDMKLQALEVKRHEVSSNIYENAKAKITEKACLCAGLATPSYLENDIKIKGQEQGVVICPWPNMAYFDKDISLSKMMQHINGNTFALSHIDRTNMFVKELKMYVDYLKNEITTISLEVTAKQIKKGEAFKSNLFDGISYYQDLFLTSISFENINIQKELRFYK